MYLKNGTLVCADTDEEKGNTEHGNFLSVFSLLTAMRILFVFLSVVHGKQTGVIRVPAFILLVSLIS